MLVNDKSHVYLILYKLNLIFIYLGYISEYLEPNPDHHGNKS